MAVPFFSDLYKIFYYLKKDPLSGTSDQKEPEGVGVTSPDVWFDLRQQMWGGGNGPLKIAIGEGGSDYIDMSSVTNRISRYKEYERLETVPEIYTALNTFADEACISGRTKIATPFGFISIEELTEKRDPDERFLAYCWDFQKNDYTLGWAYNPRIVKFAKTVSVKLDNGTDLQLTPDHRLLLANGEWSAAGDLKHGDELKPFYRLPINEKYATRPDKRFPRIFTFNDGWKHERQFIDEWKHTADQEYCDRLNKITRLISNGMNRKQICNLMNKENSTFMRQFLEQEGFTYEELVDLRKTRRPVRVVLGVSSYKEMNVYDLSVEIHQNFATDSVIAHNCQTDDDGRVYKISCDNEEVLKEADFVVHKLWDLDAKAWGFQRNLCKFGDQFLETVIDADNPKRGIRKVQALPTDTMYRMESVKGVLVEYQQAKEGPDYQSMTKVDIIKASVAQLQQATAIRFHPDQIVHMRIGDHRKTFYPYGISLLEAARGPAHQLKLMEDAMLVYRLVRAPERRVYYIDIGTISSNRSEAFIDRMKDQLRKRKVFNRKGGAQGASGVEERWQSMSPDEDIWVPIRSNSQTRIETLPGAQNLGEIDDALYFRTRLFTALQFPKNYLTNEDPSSSRLTLSQNDVKFARLIERLQQPNAKGVQDLLVRHLRMRGFAEEAFKSLDVRMTPPSDWRSINRNEVVEPLFNRAATMKGSQLFSDYDILTKILQYDKKEAKEMVSRNTAQKMEELKMALIGQNPDSLGITQLADQGTQIGATAGGPNPMLGPDGMPQQGTPPQGQQPQPPDQEGQQNPGQPPNQQPPGQPAPEGQEQQPEQTPAKSPKDSASPHLPEPSDKDIKKYNLEINDYSISIDDEETDGDGEEI